MLSMTDIVDLCTELCLKAEPGPLGVTFRWSRGSYESMTRVWYRIERGSGIAGRGGAWGVCELPAGPTHPKVTTRRALRRQLLEIMAEGTKPEPRDGFEIYARWHHTALCDSVQWFERRVRVRSAALAASTAQSGSRPGP